MEIGIERSTIGRDRVIDLMVRVPEYLGKMKREIESRFSTIRLGEPTGILINPNQAKAVWSNDLFPYELLLEINSTGNATYTGSFDDALIRGELK